MLTSFLLHLLVYCLVSLFLTILERYLARDSKRAQKYLSQPKYRSNQVITRREHISLVFRVFFNELCVSLPFTWIGYQLYWKYNLTHQPYSIVWAWIWTFMLEDILFYTFHRLLHSRPFYRFHKLHHSWTAPIPFEAMYAHPLDHLLVNVVPVFTAPMISGLPWSHMTLWGVMAAISGAVSHSGIKVFAQTHDLHHEKQRVNYGVLGLCDRVFGTYQKACA